MKTKIAAFALLASTLLAVPAMAQDNSSANTDKPATQADSTHKMPDHRWRKPIDEQTFLHMGELKAADTNHDGILSRAEIEAFAMKRIVKREADRIEHRLDINGDGKISLAAIEDHRKKEFAALDLNNDGKLEPRELRAAHRFHHHGRPGHHWDHRHHHMMTGHHMDHKGPMMTDQPEKPAE